jgi:excisionase family DNA binding protein
VLLTLEPLASTEEVAEYLGVKPQTLGYWAHKGKGPSYIKLDGRRRYSWADVRAWLEARKVNH